MRAFFVILIAMICTACSKADADRTSSDLKTAASNMARDPAVHRLGSDIKTGAQHAGAELKQGASKAKGEIAKAGDRAKQSAIAAKDKAEAKADEHKAKADEAKDKQS